MSQELPIFKYFADPVSEGVFKQQSFVCPVCEKSREWAYIASFYARYKEKPICPWCISDGSASQKFDGQFQEDVQDGYIENQEFMDELLHRTPGFSTWNPVAWPILDEDFGIYLGTVGWEEIEDRKLVEKLLEDPFIFQEHQKLKILEFLTKNGNPLGHLFKSLHSERHSIVIDGT